MNKIICFCCFLLITDCVSSCKISTRQNYLTNDYSCDDGLDYELSDTLLQFNPSDFDSTTLYSGEEIPASDTEEQTTLVYYVNNTTRRYVPSGDSSILKIVTDQRFCRDTHFKKQNITRQICYTTKGDIMSLSYSIGDCMIGLVHKYSSDYQIVRTTNYNYVYETHSFENREGQPEPSAGADTIAVKYPVCWKEAINIAQQEYPEYQYVKSIERPLNIFTDKRFWLIYLSKAPDGEPLRFCINARTGKKEKNNKKARFTDEIPDE